MQVEVTPEETAVLIRWKKRSDNHVLVRMKAEAILYASEGVGIDIIAKMVERTERTVQEWLADWRATRMCSVLTGHAGNQNAAKLTRDQKQELKAILAEPPSRTGVHAEFWDVPVLLRALSLTSKKVKLYPIEGNQNTEQTILALERLQRETETEKIAVVLDNARSHHARALTALYEPGRLLERITTIFLPPYAPDHNPAEHVRNTAKNNIANIQHETPEETLGAFASYIASRTLDYDFEHLPPRETRNDFVS